MKFKVGDKVTYNPKKIDPVDCTPLLLGVVKCWDRVFQYWIVDVDGDEVENAFSVDYLIKVG